MYRILYKTTNLINNKIYIGVHQTENLNDGYIGTGTLFIRALKKYGKENFKREVLEFFNTTEEMHKREAEIVTLEFIKQKDTYNIVTGGKGGQKNFITVKDKDNFMFQVHKNDERYISGELVGINKGKKLNFKHLYGIYVKDKDNKLKYYESPAVAKDMIILDDHCKLPLKNSLFIDDNDRIWMYKNIKDFDGNIYREIKLECNELRREYILIRDGDFKFYVKKTDERYISGEYRSIWSQVRFSDEVKGRIREGRTLDKSSRYGRVHVYNEESGERKHIDKGDLDYWLGLGWVKGVKKSVVRVREGRGIGHGGMYIYHPIKLEGKRVSGDELEVFLDDGWVRGKLSSYKRKLNK